MTTSYKDVALLKTAICAGPATLARAGSWRQMPVLALTRFPPHGQGHARFITLPYTRSTGGQRLPHYVAAGEAPIFADAAAGHPVTSTGITRTRHLAHLRPPSRTAKAAWWWTFTATRRWLLESRWRRGSLQGGSRTSSPLTRPLQGHGTLSVGARAPAPGQTILSMTAAAVSMQPSLPGRTHQGGLHGAFHGQ